MASLHTPSPAEGTASEGPDEEGSVAGGGSIAGGAGGGVGDRDDGDDGGADARSGAASGGGPAAGGGGGEDPYAAAREIVVHHIKDWEKVRDSKLQADIITEAGARNLGRWAAEIGEEFHTDFRRELRWLFGLPWDGTHLQEQAVGLFPVVFVDMAPERQEKLASLAVEWILALSKELRRALVLSQLAVLHVNNDVTQPLDIAKVLAWLKGLQTFGIDVPTLGTASPRRSSATSGRRATRRTS